MDCPFSYPNPPPCEMVFFGQAELYYPAAGIFTVPTCSSTEGTELTATLLGNGRVLVAGGETYTISDPITTTILSSAELYDPVAGSFTAASSLIVPRVRHTATLLQDATVLFAGGSGSTPASAELYEPDADEFVPTGFLNVLRESHTATLLPNGQVLIAGGFGETGNRPLWQVPRFTTRFPELLLTLGQPHLDGSMRAAVMRVWVPCWSTSIQAIVTGQWMLHPLGE